MPLRWQLKFVCCSRKKWPSFWHIIIKTKLKMAVAKCRGTMTTEASGNITPENLLSYAKTGVDYISMGALTYAAPIIDLSLKIH